MPIYLYRCPKCNKLKEEYSHKALGVEEMEVRCLEDKALMFREYNNLHVSSKVWDPEKLFLNVDEHPRRFQTEQEFRGFLKAKNFKSGQLL